MSISEIMSITETKCVILTLAALLTLIVLAASPADAVEQCRFIQAKAEREACYARQEADLAAKRAKPEPKRDSTTEALQQMKQEDAELNRQLHGICRGC